MMVRMVAYVVTIFGDFFDDIGVLFGCPAHDVKGCPGVVGFKEVEY